MKSMHILRMAALITLCLPHAALAAADWPKLLDFTERELASDNTVHLCDAYRGKVVLIVNTASKCGFTPQYEGLEKLYSDYREQGLVVLGFPSNDFGGQEPGSEGEVKSFCRLTYSVAFPMFAKSSVREGIASPLYNALAAEAGDYPTWNFHKYLLDRQGHLIGSFSSATEPGSKRLMGAIRTALAQPAGGS